MVGSDLAWWVWLGVSVCSVEGVMGPEKACQNRVVREYPYIEHTKRQTVETTVTKTATRETLQTYTTTHQKVQIDILGDAIESPGVRF